MPFTALAGLAVFFLLLAALPSAWVRKYFMLGSRWQFETKPRPSQLGLGVRAVAAGIGTAMMVALLVVLASEERPAGASPETGYFVTLAVISAVCLAMFAAVLAHNRRRKLGMLLESETDREANEQGDQTRMAGLAIAAVAIGIGWVALLAGS